MQSNRLFLSSFIFSVLFGNLWMSTQAQNVTSVKAIVVNGQIEVFFGMTDVEPNQRYSVRLYGSHDNYKSAISEKVKGAIGNDVVLNSENKIILTDPLAILGEFGGDLQFKVRTMLTYNPVAVISPVYTYIQKRGKPMTISWAGGLTTDQVRIDIYRNGKLYLESVTTVSNKEKSTTFTFPKVIATGPGYQLRMSFTTMETPIELPEFRVK